MRRRNFLSALAAVACAPVAALLPKKPEPRYTVLRGTMEPPQMIYMSKVEYPHSWDMDWYSVRVLPDGTTEAGWSTDT